MSGANLEASNLFNVNGLVAAITGGGTGLGLTMARALAANGASKIYIIGRRADKLQAAASSDPHGVLVPLPGDVTSKSSLSSMASTISRETWYLNLLIANSGISGPSMHDFPARGSSSLEAFRDFAWKTPMEDFTAVYNVNTTAVFYNVIAFLELLDNGNKKGNMGSVKSQVVTTSSIAGFNRNARAGFAYISSKAAVTHIMKVLSTFMVPYGIRFNVLAPGFFPSDLAGPLLKDLTVSDKAMTEEGAFARDFIPAERLGREEDMAGTILYLASQAGSYLNGSVVLIDGGRISTQPATY